MWYASLNIRDKECLLPLSKVLRVRPLILLSNHLLLNFRRLLIFYYPYLLVLINNILTSSFLLWVANHLQRSEASRFLPRKKDLFFFLLLLLDYCCWFLIFLLLPSFIIVIIILKLLSWWGSLGDFSTLSWRLNLVGVQLTDLFFLCLDVFLVYDDLWWSIFVLRFNFFCGRLQLLLFCPDTGLCNLSLFTINSSWIRNLTLSGSSCILQSRLLL